MSADREEDVVIIACHSLVLPVVITTVRSRPDSFSPVVEEIADTTVAVLADGVGRRIRSGVTRLSSNRRVGRGGAADGDEGGGGPVGLGLRGGVDEPAGFVQGRARRMVV